MNRSPVAALAVFSAAPFALLSVIPGRTVAPPPPDLADAREVFRAHCLGCHSTKNPMAGLNLETIAGIRKGGVSGALWKSSNPAQALLLIRMRGTDGKPRMPMGFAPLPEAKLRLVEDWIRSGASLETKEAPKRHWAYVPPVRPAPPAVQNTGWPRNPVDRFVLRRLETAKLKPSAEASAETLVRRLHLDLTGLPPTPAAIDRYLADPRPDRYERLVDQLMGSYAYGERQARFWLDLARYADSDGFEKDLSRTAWVYRDWVIDAFNRNLDFRQFTLEQLAGDLLPDPSTRQRVATGFLRNSMFNREGGVDPAEGLYHVIIDRVNTAGTTWMGSTLGCAQCHDHKYDPISQKDFYALFAVFGNVDYEERGPREVSENKYFEPEISVPSVAQRNRLAALRAERVREVERAATAVMAIPTAVPAFRTVTLASGKATSGAEVRWMDERVRVQGVNPAKDTYTLTFVADRPVHALGIDPKSDRGLPGNGPGRADNGNFVLTSIKANGRVPSSASATFSQEGFPVESTLEGGAGWAIMGQIGRDQRAVFTFSPPLPPGTVTLELGFQSRYERHALGAFGVSVGEHPESWAVLLPKNAPPEQVVRAHPSSAEHRAALKRLDDKIGAVERTIPTAMVVQERKVEGPLRAVVRSRGDFLGDGPWVTAATPAFADPEGQSRPANRLSFARWLFRPDHPLTGRVWVNRLWEQYFGRGLVETTEDFGTQSSPPLDRELLDWLAVEFVQSGWNMKHMHRLIVTSAAYRQSSTLRPDLAQRDPQNKLFARAHRHRLDAETLRDQLLFVSGRLKPRRGGPSVYPPQPDGIWNSPHSGEQYPPSVGDDRYRRSLYTFIKRTAPFPMFTTFDAGSREACLVKRTATNTPLQALNMLNDPTVMDASRGLAERMAAASGDWPDRLTFGFRWAVGRSPSRAESAQIERLFDDLRTRYRAQPDNQAKPAATIDLAAAALVANVLFNLDEVLTRG